MELNNLQLDELIRYYQRKSQRPITTRFTLYSKEVATETLAALEELQKLRAGIRVEGMVS
jgi:hypothetical protein